MRYTLPDLDYDFGALEPHISGRIMELHHGHHHAAYVKNTNHALTLLEEVRATEDFARLPALERILALAPQSGGRPDGELARAIDRNFGSFEKFKRQLTGVASTLMGSGWAALIWEPVGHRLLTLQIHDHEANLSQKAAFFEAAWHLWDWSDVSERFEAARRLDLLVPGGAGS